MPSRFVRTPIDDLIRAHLRALQRYVYKRGCKDRQRNREVVHETLVRAFLSKRRSGVRNVLAWLKGIARNVMKGEGRPRWSCSCGDPDDMADTRRISPDDAVENRATKEAVQRAVGYLPSKQRLVVLLTYYEDLNGEDVARIVGAPLGTVKSRLRLAHEKLHPALENFSPRLHARRGG